VADILDMSGKRLAVATQDARKWTPKDALQDTLNECETRDIDQIVIHYRYKVPGETIVRTGFAVAGCTYDQHIAMLQVATHEVIDSYRGKE
jgi:hypothetical protein